MHFTTYMYVYQVFLKYYHVDHLDKLMSKFERSAIVLQSLIRGWRARRAVARLKKQQRRNQAAILIQAGKHSNGFLTRYILCNDISDERLAVPDSCKETKEREDQCSYCHSSWSVGMHVTLCTHCFCDAGVRCWLAKSQYAALLMKRTKAATKIQSGW